MLVVSSSGGMREAARAGPSLARGRRAIDSPGSISQYRIEGLGHLSTLVADERPAWPPSSTRAATSTSTSRPPASDGLRISHVVETHLHNDYVSGGRELAALPARARHRGGRRAGLRPPAAAPTASRSPSARGPLPRPRHARPHARARRLRGCRHGAGRRAGPAVHRRLAPGRRGRPDRSPRRRARPPLSRRRCSSSLHDAILRHEDFVAVFPTHGAGSLCSTGIGSTAWSTIGFERRFNPLLQPIEIEAFARLLLAGQPAVPALLRPDAPDRTRPAADPGGIPAPLPVSLAELRHVPTRRGVLVDLRSPRAFADGHVPGSLSIPAACRSGPGWAGSSTSTVPSSSSCRAAADAARTRRPGMTPSAGLCGSATSPWPATSRVASGRGGRPACRRVEWPPAASPSSPAVVDRGRQPTLPCRRRPPGQRVRGGHVPGAWHIGAGDLPGRLADLPRDRPIAAICASRLPGERRGVAPRRGRLHERQLGGRRRDAWLVGRRPAGRVRPGRRGPLPCEALRRAPPASTVTSSPS